MCYNMGDSFKIITWIKYFNKTVRARDKIVSNCVSVITGKRNIWKNEDILLCSEIH